MVSHTILKVGAKDHFDLWSNQELIQYDLSTNNKELLDSLSINMLHLVYM